jgi:hypothetical protein
MKAYKGVAKRRNLLKAFKGFDKRLRCRGFQYEVGKEYQEPEAELCHKGFHACENPLDTLRYYPPTDSRYCEVEIDDNGQRNSEDSKVCGEKIKIVSEIGLDGVIKAGAQFIFEMCKGSAEDHASGRMGNAAASGWSGNAAASGESGNAAASGESGNAAASGWSGNAAASGWRGNAAASGERGNAAASGVRGNAAASGERGNAAASGERGNAAASGESGNAAASGVRGTATVTGRDGRASAIGEQCIAVAWGRNSLAKGTLGNWIVVSERGNYGDIFDAKLARVDGEIIKPDTWYTLRNGKIMEAE